LKKYSIRSTLAQAGHFIDNITGTVVPPIHPSTTFARNCDYELIGDYKYSRYENPTYEQVENLAGKLDNGVDAKLFSSGMAAITAFFETVHSGQHIAAPTIMYHGAQDWLRHIAKRRNIGLTLFNATDPEALRQAIKPGETAVVWIETPVNPTWDVIDIADAATAAHEVDALLGVDCTISTPITTRALNLGADIVIHSLTKFINGHADIVGGAIVTKSEELYNQLRKTMVYTGANMDPHQAFMVIRGVKTLSLRIDKAQENAQQIAEFLENHKKVEWVKYPGLKSFPQSLLAIKQMNGFGSMISFGLKGGYEAGKVLMDNVHLATLAVSLGGVETLIQHPASMTHAGVSKENKEAAHITDGLVRYSVGIEDEEDLIYDLSHALELVADKLY